MIQTTLAPGYGWVPPNYIPACTKNEEKKVDVVNVKWDQTIARLRTIPMSVAQMSKECKLSTPTVRNRLRRAVLSGRAKQEYGIVNGVRVLLYQFINKGQ
jgi:hypothetical protein